MPNDDDAIRNISTVFNAIGLALLFSFCEILVTLHNKSIKKFPYHKVKHSLMQVIAR